MRRGHKSKEIEKLLRTFLLYVSVFCTRGGGGEGVFLIWAIKEYAAPKNMYFFPAVPNLFLKGELISTTRMWDNVSATFLLPLPQVLQNLQLSTSLPQLLQNILARIFQANHCRVIERSYKMAVKLKTE